MSRKITSLFKKQVIAKIVLLVAGMVISIGLSYVHATGVWNEPATSTPPEANTDFPVVVDGPWVSCASEGETCTFNGLKIVRYGTGSSHVEKYVTGPVACNNTTFGDPAPNAAKTCQYTNVQVKGSDALGGLKVNEFSALQNAQFDANAIFQKLLLGLADTTNPTESALSIGDGNTTVHLALDGKEYTYKGGLYSEKIKVSANEFKPLCADVNGNIILCPPPAVPTPPIPPKDIYGSVMEWCDNGEPRLRFTFNTATPVAFNMKLAMCTLTYWDSSKIACWGTDLLNTVGEQRPWPSPSGTNADSRFYSRPTAFDIAIPSGSTTYTTPNLQANGEKAFCRGSGRLMESVQYTYGTQYPYPTYFTLLLKMLNNTDYTLHLTGSTMYKSDPKFNSFTPIIIK